MLPSKCTNRKCEICGRKDFNARMLGPLIHTPSISAHFKCVLFSPQTPDKTSFAERPEDDAIAGVTSRFIRSVGAHARKMVIICLYFSLQSSCTYKVALLLFFSEMRFLQKRRRQRWMLFRYRHWYETSCLFQEVSCGLWTTRWSIVRYLPCSRNGVGLLRSPKSNWTVNNHQKSNFNWNKLIPVFTLSF